MNLLLSTNGQYRQVLPAAPYDSVTARSVHLLHGDSPYTYATLIVPGRALQALQLPSDRLTTLSEKALDAIHVRDVRERALARGEVVVWCEHSLLARGLEIVDTPGLSESSMLDSAVGDLVRGMRPSVLFVVGRTLGLHVPFNDNEQNALRELSKTAGFFHVLVNFSCASPNMTEASFNDDVLRLRGFVHTEIDRMRTLGVIGSEQQPEVNLVNLEYVKAVMSDATGNGATLAKPCMKPNSTLWMNFQHAFFQRAVRDANVQLKQYYSVLVAAADELIGAVHALTHDNARLSATLQLLAKGEQAARNELAAIVDVGSLARVLREFCDAHQARLVELASVTAMPQHDNKRFSHTHTLDTIRFQIYEELIKRLLLVELSAKGQPLATVQERMIACTDRIVQTARGHSRSVESPRVRNILDQFEMRLKHFVPLGNFMAVFSGMRGWQSFRNTLKWIAGAGVGMAIANQLLATNVDASFKATCCRELLSYIVDDERTCRAIATTMLESWQQQLNDALDVFFQSIQLLSALTRNNGMLTRLRLRLPVLLNVVLAADIASSAATLKPPAALVYWCCKFWFWSLSFFRFAFFDRFAFLFCFVFFCLRVRLQKFLQSIMMSLVVVVVVVVIPTTATTQTTTMVRRMNDRLW